MAEATVQRPSAGNVAVSGELGAQSVPGLLRASEGWFDDGGELTTVDLGNVERADSAGVALLLEWLRQAREHGTQIQYTNAPKQMLDIIGFCALEDVLPLQ